MDPMQVALGGLVGAAVVIAILLTVVAIRRFSWLPARATA